MKAYLHSLTGQIPKQWYIIVMTKWIMSSTACASVGKFYWTQCPCGNLSHCTMLIIEYCCLQNLHFHLPLLSMHWLAMIRSIYIVKDTRHFTPLINDNYSNNQKILQWLILLMVKWLVVQVWLRLVVFNASFNTESSSAKAITIKCSQPLYGPRCCSFIGYTRCQCRHLRVDGMSLESADPHDSGVLRQKIESKENLWKTRYL